MVKAPLNRSSSELLLAECSEIEEALAALKVAYEQYFMGMERFAPTKTHDALKKRINKLRTSLKGSTAAKFRTQTLIGKFQTYERLWERTILEIENGIYRRDVYKLKRKQGAPTQRKTDSSALSEEIDANFDEADDLESAMAAAVKAVNAATPARTASGAAIPAVAPVQRTVSGGAIPAVAPLVPPLAAAATPASAAARLQSLPRPSSPGGAPVAATLAGAPGAPPRPGVAAPAARPGAPAAVARPGPPASAAARPANLDDGKLRAVYDAYVTAKKQCREDTSKLSYESVADNLRKQVPALMKQHGANSVDFKVVIKDGKAVLRAIPK